MDGAHSTPGAQLGRWVSNTPRWHLEGTWIALPEQMSAGAPHSHRLSTAKGLETSQGHPVLFQ